MPPRPSLIEQLLNSPAILDGQATDANADACYDFVHELERSKKPASSEQIAAILKGLFEAMGAKPPTDDAAKIWLVALADVPEKILRQAVIDLIRESSYAPKPADVYKRAKPLMLSIDTEISAVRALARQIQARRKDILERQELERERVTPEQMRQLRDSIGRAAKAAQ